MKTELSDHFSDLRLLSYEVDDECERQVIKWGVQNHDVGKWLLILAEEFGEAAKEANEIHFRQKDTEEYRKELIQVAAVALSAIASLDRGNK